jgi:hypothetical protein
MPHADQANAPERGVIIAEGALKRHPVGAPGICP